MLVLIFYAEERNIKNHGCKAVVFIYKVKII